MSELLSPKAKPMRKDSPVSKKRLEYRKNTEDVMTSRLNVDDLNCDESDPTYKIIVLIAYPNSGNIIVKSNFDDDSRNIIKNICLSKWQTVANFVCRHQTIYPEFLRAIQVATNKELANFSKSSDSCFKITSPDQLATFSNKILWHEVSVHCPVYAAVVQGVCNMASKTKEDVINAAALATSSLVRVRNPQMSAIAYQISTILAHSGVSFRNFTRLNHLKLKPKIT